MKQKAIYLLLALSVGHAHAQTNSNSDWNLDKYLWSHMHHDPLKPGKPILDFDLVDNWRSLGRSVGISPDGRYFVYDILKGQNGEHTGSFHQVPAEFVVEAADHSWRYSIQPTVTMMPGFFSKDGKQFIYQEKTDLNFLKLGESKPQVVADVESFVLPTGKPAERVYDIASDWIAITFKNKDVVVQNLTSGKQERFAGIGSGNFDLATQRFIYQTSGDSPELVFYSLVDGTKKSFPAPQAYVPINGGSTLLMNRRNALDSVNVSTGAVTNLWKAASSNESLNSFTLDESGKQMVLSIKTTEGDGKDAPSFSSIWIKKEGMAPRMLISQKTAVLPEGFTLQGGAAFSNNGRYLTLSMQKPAKVYTVPKGAPKPLLWSSRDKFLQTTQAKHKNDPTTLSMIMDAETGKIVYTSKADESGFMQGDFLIVKKGETDKNSDRFWDPTYNKSTTTIQNLKNGAKYALPVFPTPWSTVMKFTPDRNYVVYFDQDKKNFYSLDLRNGKTSNICQGLKPGQFVATDWGTLGEPKSNQVYGEIYWLPNSQGFLTYDDYDLWQLDPSGNRAPVCVTNGYGRKNNIVFRFAHKPEENGVITEDKFLMVGYNLKTKYNGYFSTKMGSGSDPETLTYGPQFVHGVGWATHLDDQGMEPLKAADTNSWLVKRHTPESGANYYLTQDFKTLKPLTTIASHKNVNWYTSELHKYKCLTGEDGEGVLYKPENFDPKKKYPVIIPFYGQYSSYLYVYQNPQYPWSPVAFATGPGWLASHGYIVFVPKIFTAPLKHGPASFSAIEGAAKYLQTIPYVDGKHIGACTHSWSSKLGAYLFTHSKYISAMSINEGYLYGNVINMALAPTDDDDSNLDSVENGFEYGELWKNKETWLDQTTVLNVDKARMPLLLSSSAGDFKREYARQGFEIFTALRRLNKPAWWFQYSSMQHNIGSLAEQKDFAIRFLQFFDHYFKGAPAPVWMTQGIPNAVVGAEPRLDLDPSGSCDDNCEVCKKARR